MAIAGGENSRMAGAAAIGVTGSRGWTWNSSDSRQQPSTRLLPFARLAGIDIEIRMKPSSKPGLTVKTRAA